MSPPAALTTASRLISGRKPGSPRIPKSTTSARMPLLFDHRLHKGELRSFGIERSGDDDGFHFVRHRLTPPNLMILEGFDGAHHRLFYGDAFDA